MADKLKIRQENGKYVVETMKDIGGPATFQKIKSSVMGKMNVSMKNFNFRKIQFKIFNYLKI